MVQSLNQDGLIVGDRTLHTLTGMQTMTTSSDVFVSPVSPTRFSVCVSGYSRGDAGVKVDVRSFEVAEDRSITQLSQQVFTGVNGQVAPGTFTNQAFAASAGGQWAVMERRGVFIGYYAGDGALQEIWVQPIFEGLVPGESLSSLQGLTYLGELLIVGTYSYDDNRDCFGYLTFDGAIWSYTKLGEVVYGVNYDFVGMLSIFVADIGIGAVVCVYDYASGVEDRQVYVVTPGTSGRGVLLPGVSHWDAVPGVTLVYKNQMWLGITDGNGGYRNQVVAMDLSEAGPTNVQLTEGPGSHQPFNPWAYLRLALPEVVMGVQPGYSLDQYTNSSMVEPHVNYAGYDYGNSLSPVLAPVGDIQWETPANDADFVRGAFCNLGKKLIAVSSPRSGGFSYVWIYDIDWLDPVAVAGAVIRPGRVGFYSRGLSS